MLQILPGGKFYRGDARPTRLIPAAFIFQNGCRM